MATKAKTTTVYAVQDDREGCRVVPITVTETESQYSAKGPVPAWGYYQRMPKGSPRAALTPEAAIAFFQARAATALAHAQQEVIEAGARVLRATTLTPEVK